MIDLRSDTVTRPTQAMREAMARAEVGDDVYREDPTVAELEAETAALTGFEAALFVPSGTMGNQLAIALHTRPGDEVMVGEGAHPVWYECGAAAALSGVQFATLGAGGNGIFGAADVDACLRPHDYYYPRSALVCVENTLNRAGGRVFPQALVVGIVARAHARGLATHLDGARLWNAAVASGVAPSTLCAGFDTASVCFSKGLGAPVGSALAGSRDVVDRALRLRKMWGGGMRQAGILAAGALFALRHHRARLAEDHAHARLFADHFRAMTEVARPGVRTSEPETNIVNIDLDCPAPLVVEAARALQIGIGASGPCRLRAVTHLDVSRADVEKAAEALFSVLRNCLPTPPASR